MRVQELPNNGPIARGLVEKARASTHRSLYLPLLRGITPNSLEVFDFAEQGMVTGRRDTTTVATQSLYLLNDPFVRRRALDLAERVLAGAGTDDGRLDLASRLTLGRSSDAREVERARGYLAECESAARAILEATPDEPVVVVAKEAEPAEKAPARDPTPPIDPDQVVQVDAPVREEIIRPKDARTAAWASYCQALLGSAEFRYLR